MATGSGNKISRKPHIFRFDGFTRTGEAGKLQVQTRNTELSGGGAYPAYALADVVLKGENVVFPAGEGTIVRAATPAEVSDGVQYEDAIIVTSDLSVYRYEPNTGGYTELTGIALSCLPTIVPYLSAEKDEYAVLFGGTVAAVRAGGTVKTFAESCYKNYGCAAAERLFFAADGKTVKYSGVLDPGNTTESADEGGYIVLPADSDMRGMCALGKYVYVFFEKEAYRLDGRGAARDFSAEKMCYCGGRIYENSVFACGNGICFVTDEGIYFFDGTTFANVTKKRTEFSFSDLKMLYCAGAAGKFLCQFGKSALLTKSVLYNTETGALSEIQCALKTACAYGERLFVNRGGEEKEFLFGKRASDDISYTLQRLNEDFSKKGVKTLKRLTLYGTGTAEVNVYCGKETTPKTYVTALSETGKSIEVNESAESFSFTAFLSGGTTLTGAEAEVYAFGRK